MPNIRENIRAFRTKKGLKQSELGELLGKAPSVIANWEAGTNRPDVGSIEKLCSIFEVDANTLLGWSKQERPVTLYKGKPVGEMTAMALAAVENLNEEEAVKAMEFIQFLKSQRSKETEGRQID